MSQSPSTPDPDSVSTYVEDGARIAGILLVWGAVALVSTYWLSNFGEYSLFFGTVGPQLGALFALTGVLNAVLYVFYRTADHWHAQA